jgi:predicted porin
MKKSLVALATLAVAGVASAQSSVTLFGVVDASISGYSSTSRDLGRDYTATFWNDTVFDPFGTNGVGTNLISTANGFNTAGGTGGFGGNANYVRASNTIGYFLPPNLGGFYGQLQYAFHERDKYDNGNFTPATALSRSGRYIGGRFGYANGPLDVAIAYGNSTTGDNFYGGSTDAVKTLNLGASYDFGPVKLFGEVSRAKNTRDFEGNYVFQPVNPPDVDLTGYLIGVTVPVGAGLIRASYSAVKYDLNAVQNPFVAPVRDPKANKLALGYVHNLSKRTALYATVARVSNKNGAALTVGGPAFVNNNVFTPRSSTGYDFGIRHAF